MNTAKIIAVTKPLVEGIDTAEEFVAYTARVSNPSNQMNKETSSKLLRYCINNKHWSIFEQVSITMDIVTTRDIAHQIIRHRSFSFQEFSQRYSNPTEDMGFVTREARLQDHKNRQNSIEITEEEKWNYYKDFSSMTKQEAWEKMQSEVAETSKYMYEEAIRMGIAKEQARSVLPEGLTKTRLYMSGTLRSWIHYIDVRAEEGTQKEHREIAIQAREEILKQFPSLKEYWFPNLDEREPSTSDSWLPRNKPAGVNETKSWWWMFWS